MKKRRRDPVALRTLAAAQAGYFTSSQAAQFGFSPALCSNYAKQGKFVRQRRGLYRLAEQPPFGMEKYFFAWLATGRSDAAISHQSALVLYGLLEDLEDWGHPVHITIARALRRAAPSGVIFHTSVRPWREGDVCEREGLKITAVGRSILDFASAGASQDQLRPVVGKATEGRFVSADELLFLAQEHGGRAAGKVQAATYLAEVTRAGETGR